MPEFTFGEWKPDEPRIGMDGLSDLNNAVPTARGYKQWNGVAPVVGKTPLGGPCVGAWAGESRQGLKYIVAAAESGGVNSGPALWGTFGTGADLWDLSPASELTGLEDGENFEFAQFGDIVIATARYLDAGPQTFDVGPANPSISDDFSALSDHASAAGCIATFRDFVILGDIKGRGNNASAIGTAENGLHWCAIGDPTSWPTVGQQAAVDVQSDFQLLEGGAGRITAIVPTAEFCLVFQERATWRLDYVGLPAVFSLRRISPEVGCIIPRCAVAARNVAYFLGENGFMMCDGARVIDIGTERVDDTILGLIDLNNTKHMTAVYAANEHSILWTIGEGAVAPGTFVGYHFELNRWFKVSGANQYYWLFRAHSLALSGSLDDAPLATQNMDTGSDLAVSNLDLLGLTDQRNGIAFFDTQGEMAFHTPEAPKPQMSLATGEYEIPDERRAILRYVRPFYETNEENQSLSGFVTSRDWIQESEFENFALLEFDRDRGILRARANNRIGGRYMRIVFGTSGDVGEVYGFDVGLRVGPRS